MFRTVKKFGAVAAPITKIAINTATIINTKGE